MQKTNVTALVEAGVMTGIAVMAGLISAYIPLIGAFLSRIWPVPIILLGVRHGYKWSLLATVASGLLIALLTDPVRSAKVLVLCPVGIVMGYTFRAGYSPFKTLVLGTVASLISLGLETILTIALLGFNPFAFDAASIDQLLGEAVAMYRRMGVGEDQIAQMAVMMQGFFDLMKLVIPAVFLFSAVFLAGINLIAVRILLKRLGHAVQDIPAFKDWMLPRYVLVIFILGMALSYWGKSQEMDSVLGVGANLFYLGAALVLIQGLAVFYYLADKYNLSRLMRGIILLLIFSTPLFGYAVVYAGALDLALDYRKLRTPRSP